MWVHGPTLPVLCKLIPRSAFQHTCAVCTFTGSENYLRSAWEVVIGIGGQREAVRGQWKGRKCSAGILRAGSSANWLSMGSVPLPTHGAFRQGFAPVWGAWNVGTVCLCQTFVSAGRRQGCSFAWALG